MLASGMGLFRTNVNNGANYGATLDSTPLTLRVVLPEVKDTESKEEIRRKLILEDLLAYAIDRLKSKMLIYAWPFGVAESELTNAMQLYNLNIDYYKANQGGEVLKKLTSEIEQKRSVLVIMNDCALPLPINLTDEDMMDAPAPTTPKRLG